MQPFTSDEHAVIAAAIDRCGKILAEHFPPSSGDRDELPNHLIVLDVAEPA